MNVVRKLEPAGCGCGDTGGRLPSVDQALRTGLLLVHPIMEIEVLSLQSAAGRVLAEPVRAAAMAPPFDNSAMDGFAVRSGDFAGQGPWDLPVQGRLAAGDGRDLTLGRGTAARIFTGAPVPRGADAVIMQEHTENTGTGRVYVTRSVTSGQHIRRAGEDMEKGAEVLSPGKRLSSRDIAAAAAAGASTLRVRRRPRVALIASGDEVFPAGTALPTGGIWDVNTPMLRALIEESGAEIVSAEFAPDDVAALGAQMSGLSDSVDVLVTTGGVSVGEEDHMQNAVQGAGGAFDVSGVAIKPGKPVTIGKLGNALWLGLPGNPVSAYVTWQVFGCPLLEKLSGATDASLPKLRYVAAAEALRHKLGRSEYRPASIVGIDGSGREIVSCSGGVQSGQVVPLAKAAGFVLIPANVSEVASGDLLEFHPFANN